MYILNEVDCGNVHILLRASRKKAADEVIVTISPLCYSMVRVSYALRIMLEIMYHPYLRRYNEEILKHVVL